VKHNKILSIIVIFAIIDILYMIFCPTFPAVPRPNGYAYWRCIFYIDHYGIVSIISLFLTLAINKCYKYLKDLITIYDRTAISSLTVYSAYKLVFYIFLINKDMITYIAMLNSKAVDIVFSIIVWTLAALGSYSIFKNKEKLL
jgi:hypothetical protein